VRVIRLKSGTVCAVARTKEMHVDGCYGNKTMRTRSHWRLTVQRFLFVALRTHTVVVKTHSCM